MACHVICSSIGTFSYFVTQPYLFSSDSNKHVCLNNLCLAACLQTITLLGPMFGFLLGSYCAKLYVDIGYVDMGKFSASVLGDACIISYMLASCNCVCNEVISWNDSNRSDDVSVVLTQLEVLTCSHKNRPHTCQDRLSRTFLNPFEELPSFSETEKVKLIIYLSTGAQCCY